MANGSIAYHWESQVEMAYMMLEYHRFTGANIDRYMPFIKNSLLFFEDNYQKREQLRNGGLWTRTVNWYSIPPHRANRTGEAKNPVDLISGIAACLEALLELQSDSLSPEDKRHFKTYLDKLPGFNYEVIKGDKVLKPAESYIKYQNVECPQFYPLSHLTVSIFEASISPFLRTPGNMGNFRKIW